jgi:hypothetical protein
MNDKNREWLRDQYLSGRGLLGPFLFNDEMQKSRLFLETMEDFISSSEETEVNSLSKGIEELTESQKDEFWQWNYPVHWQEIFATRIRSSFIVQLCSFVEGELEELCKRIEVIAGIPLKLRDLQGSTLAKGRKYLEAFGNFSAPSGTEWLIIERIFDLRNVCVHERGFVTLYRNEKKLVEFAQTAPGLAFENGFAEMKRDFCEYALSAIIAFHNCLLKEYEAFRLRSQVLEKLQSASGA